MNSIVTRSAERGLSISGQRPQVGVLLHEGRPGDREQQELDAEQQREPDAQRHQQPADVIADPAADREPEQSQHQAHAGRGRADEQQ